MTDAATISVRETLDVLSGSFATLAQALHRAQYAIWLGSGLSRDRVPRVGEVVIRVLEHLRSRADIHDPDCRFRRALTASLELAMLGPLEQPAIDLATPVNSWAIRDVLRERLTPRYADLLNVRVDEEAPDYMLWDALDVVGTYAPHDADPDCEHLCLAILILEGTIQFIVSANWDGLIELAVEELTGGTGHPLQVCVIANDLSGPPGRCIMYKLHGCAVLARDNPGAYRDLLIARARQITGWTAGVWADSVKNRLIDLAATKPTLMIGLSAQDSNIQYIFVQGSERASWPWPSDPPTHVFAENSIGEAQRSILQQAYRDEYDANHAEIDASALLRSFAKPLLVALVLDLLASKLSACISMSGSAALDATGKDEVISGVKYLRDLVAAEADNDRLAFIRSLIGHVHRANCLFRDGRPDSWIGAYRPFSSLPLGQLEHDPDVASSGLIELSVALGIIGSAHRRGDWLVRAGDPSIETDGVLRLSSKTEARIFFASNPGAATGILSNVIDPSDAEDAVIIHSQALVSHPRRSPRSTFRTGSSGPREISMDALLAGCGHVDELVQRLREEIGV